MNYIEYEMDDKNLKYTITRTDGSRRSVPYRITGSNAEVYDVPVSVSANEIRLQWRSANFD
jgi:hypothetical protein